MRPALLFDENLSPHLVARLSDAFPHSTHVNSVGLASADDRAVWNHAREHAFVIVTKDDDFRQLSFLLGAPPKVVWVHIGNCRTTEIETLLRTRASDVEAFCQDEASSLLVLRR